ncbi:MAG: hydroxymethylglutaryl-CoA synthase [Patescibacteria group bacterium]
MKQFTKVGIVGYGSYVPEGRVKTNICSKAVAQADEDAATLAWEAATAALALSKLAANKIGAVYIGSESHPYAVKPTATMVGEALGMGHDYLAADLEFACKAGTAGVQIIAAEVESGLIDYGLAIGSDVAQARPGDALEYTAGSGAAALILGKDKRQWKAVLEYTGSYSSDTPDFWRRNGAVYPSHAGRFTGEPAYFKHVIEGTKRFFKATGFSHDDFRYVVLHMPNGKFPRRAAKTLGITDQQLSLGLVVDEIGNPYSASSLIGLCRVLEQLKGGDRVLVTSYGSGSGSDSFSFKGV